MNSVKIVQFATLGGYLFLAKATAENNDQNNQQNQQQDVNHGIVPKRPNKPPIEKSKSPRLFQKFKKMIKKMDQ
uniref:Uncharacterized protein n=1 Tax=Panagrolaimus sp. PS1159 TaxID=55785 RepID=A0AC35GTK6_9BILA